MTHTDNRGLQALRERAYALAESGRYQTAVAVERALVAEGWPNAAQMLQSDYLRTAIGERCHAATAAGGMAQAH